MFKSRLCDFRCFSNVLVGAAWWFNDTVSGINRQLETVSEYAVLGTNLGMLTDSRSFSSYVRFDFSEEYLRRLSQTRSTRANTMKRARLRLQKILLTTTSRRLSVYENDVSLVWRKDCIPLNYIKQIQGMSGVVTAVYDTPVGEVWDVEKLERLKRLSNDAGLEMEVIESVPVHEDIKLGKPSRDKYIEAYKQNIINCGKVGVKCICYNFMPVFDWLRTDLYFKHKDGATSLAYDHENCLRSILKSAFAGLGRELWSRRIERAFERIRGYDASKVV